MADFTHKRTGRTVTVGDGLADRYRNSGRWTEVSGESLTAELVVPTGTVAEILEWADTDAKREAALAAERAGKNRKGIIDALS